MFMLILNTKMTNINKYNIVSQYKALHQKRVYSRKCLYIYKGGSSMG